MARGIFMSTFYVPEAPEVLLEDLNLQLTPAEQRIFDDVMQTEPLERLIKEIGAVGNGLVWNKDHFEMIPSRHTAQCDDLQDHSK